MTSHTIQDSVIARLKKGLAKPAKEKVAGSQESNWITYLDFMILQSVLGSSFSSLSRFAMALSEAACDWSC